jgi:hypothetical protein
MIIVDINKKDTDGEWKEFMPGLEICIRPIFRSTYHRLRDEATVEEVVIENGKEVKKTKLDPKLLETLNARQAVGDWKGVVDKKKKPLPCTDEIKDIVFDRMPGLAVWAVAEANGAGICVVKEKEARAKNLRSSHGGKKSDPKA